MRKRGMRSEFACSIKNLTPQAIKLTVPLGYVDGLPAVSNDEYDQILETNRRRYCAPIADVRALLAASQVLRREASDALDPMPPLNTRAATEIAGDGAPIASSVQREARRADVALSGAARKSADTAGAAPLRRREHTYLQELITQAAQERGFRATMEAPVSEGGRVDVSLEHGGTRIACEISVSSTPEQELGNVRKCLAAGYGQVILLSSDARRVQSLRTSVLAGLTEPDHEKVHFLLPQGLIARLDEIAAASQATETTVRGYRVKVTHKPVDPREAEERRKAIAKVIATSLKQIARDTA
jgi:hypothetical protein